jgi:hypothetical protein
MTHPYQHWWCVQFERSAAPLSVWTLLHQCMLTFVFTNTHGPRYVEHAGNTTTLGVLARAVTETNRMCLAASSSGQGLTIALCGLTSASASPAVSFKLDHNFTAPDHVRPQQVRHVASGRCVELGKGGIPTLAACVAGDASQKFVYGTSGRLCSSGRCLSVGH